MFSLSPGLSQPTPNDDDDDDDDDNNNNNTGVPVGCPGVPVGCTCVPECIYVPVIPCIRAYLCNRVT